MRIGEARRIALAAQGFDRARKERATKRDVRAIAERLGVVQLDSVNVFVRAHYAPPFSRLGAYPMTALDALVYEDRALFEYWAHEASLVPVAMQPLFRWRMERAARGEGTWGFIARFGKEKRAYCEDVLREVERRGALRPSDLSDTGEKRRGRWWTRSDAKIALEWLFWAGRVTTATRRQFERVYDIPERVLPHAILDAPTPSPADAHRELLRIAARALGVMTEDDLRDYYRLKPGDARPRIAELVEEGTLERVDVEGWTKPALLFAGARAPRTIGAAALVSPFDPIVWFRPRAERLFGFHYRIEIYVPEHLRTHGYYVVPFLFGDRLAARVDLKAERATKVLEVRSAHVEGHAHPVEVAPALATELRRTAEWLGLDDVAVVTRRGKLAPALRAALR